MMRDDPVTDETPEFSRPIAVRKLSQKTGLDFDETATVEERHALARLFGASSVPKFRFNGSLRPMPDGIWQLEATLGASIVQPCVVTLQPVKTRIDLNVRRSFVPGLSDDRGEIDILIDDESDDETEPLTPIIDLGLVATESAALALPAYPRAEGAVLEQDRFAPPGIEPMSEEETKPFAALGAMRKPSPKT